MPFIIGYILFFFALLFAKLKRSNRIIDRNGLVSNPSILLLLHIVGIILFGLLPILFADKSFLQVAIGKSQPPDTLPAITIGLTVIVLIVVPRLADKDVDQIKRVLSHTPLGPAFLTNYFILRIAFLCCYEVSFRGYFLSATAEAFGWIIAATLNIVLYVLIHFVNGKDEMKGCIPLGLIFCSLCFWGQAAWPAIVLHVAITTSYETRLLNKINHPSIAIV